MREAILKEEEEEMGLKGNKGKKVSSMRLMKKSRYKPGVNTAIDKQ